MFITTEKERILNLKAIKKISITAIAFSFMLFVKPASAQLMNLHELPEGEMAYNLGYFYNSSPTAKECNLTHTGLFSWDYGYHDDLKFSIIGSLGGGNGDLSPGLKLRFMHIGQTQSPYFGYFFRSDWGGIIPKCPDFRRIDLTATTGFSVFARIINDPAWELKPFIGIVQSINYFRPLADSKEWYSDFSSKGEVGLELELGPGFSVLGSWEFVFNNSNYVLHTCINLHY